MDWENPAFLDEKSLVWAVSGSALTMQRGSSAARDHESEEEDEVAVICYLTMLFSADMQ